jgi:hypothetical protein
MDRKGAFAWALIACLIAGCGSAASTMRVWGDVSYENLATKDGNIEFIPIEGTPGPNVGGVIKDGSYEIPAEKGPLREGVYRVEIKAFVDTGVVSAGPRGKNLPQRKPIFPPEYNIRSTLRVQISARAADNQFDFHLAKPNAREEGKR